MQYGISTLQIHPCGSRILIPDMARRTCGRLENSLRSLLSTEMESTIMEQPPQIQQLRKLIDAKHDEALRALAVLGQYLADGGVLPPAPAAHQHTQIGNGTATANEPERGSYRRLVLAAI